jgi:RNA polymerase sigma factor (sigma-70 family)
MTTAPEFPTSGLPATALPASGHPSAGDVTAAPIPAQPTESLPRLTLVPTLVPEQAAPEIVDFDAALAAAIPRLQRYAARRLSDVHEAEEVVQEAMLRAFQHREMLATEDDLMAWLTVVTGRLVIDRLRVRGRMTPVAELPPSSRAGRDTADVVVARDEARLALDALEAMPSRQAAVLWAREVEGMSYDEIGERFDLSEPTVRSLLHRARKTLRREYAERGGTLPAMGLVALAPWLKGLRFAGRIRDVARRGGAAAAVAATGLVVATVAPLWSGPAHAHPIAAPPVHAYVANAHTTHATSARPAAAKLATAGGGSHAGGSAETHSPSSWIPHVACGQTVNANCTAHTGNTLFVILPVKGLPTGNDIGVATNDVPCAAVPDTAATHCQAGTQNDTVPPGLPTPQRTNP